MKKQTLSGILLVAAAASILVVFAWKASGSGPQNISSTVNTARYVLFSGTYGNINGVFKLDTYTGETWILKAETTNGNVTEKWNMLPSTNSSAAKTEKAGTRIPGEE